MLDSLVGLFLNILLPAGGLSPLSIVLWFGIVFIALRGAVRWLLGLLHKRGASFGRVGGAVSGLVGFDAEGADIDRRDAIDNAAEIAMFNKAERGEVSWREYLDFHAAHHKGRGEE